MFTQNFDSNLVFGINLGFYFGTAIFFLILFLLYRKKAKKLEAEKLNMESVKKEMTEIREYLGKIVESQRLSTILKIEPASLKIEQHKFDPRKESLKKSMDEALATMRAHPDPDVYAYTILNRIGFQLFVEGEICLKIQHALGKLIANQTEKKDWSDFLNGVIEQL